MCDEDETSRDRTVGLEENGRTSKVLYQLCSETCATVSGRRAILAADELEKSSW